MYTYIRVTVEPSYMGCAGLRTPMLLTAPYIPPNNEQMPDLILNKRALI